MSTDGPGPIDAPEGPDALLGQLERSRSLGFLGPGPVADHLDHADAFVAALASTTGRVVDLGSGGGVPGLVLARARPDLDLVFVDAMGKRCDFLRQAVEALGFEHVEVVHARAETVGRGPLRGTSAVVVARSFGPPAVTAECAAPLLGPKGRVLVSEPPDAPSERWPTAGLAELGLAAGPVTASAPRLRWLVQVAPCPDTYPRRNGVPAKRPLF